MSATILIIDDDENSRVGLVEVLEDEGFATVGVDSGAAGLELLKGREFDLVITDLRMPGMDGMEVLRQVRALCPQTLIMLVTAYASLETAVEALRSGAQDYIIKPLIYEEVVGKISRVLENRDLAFQVRHLRSQVESRYSVGEIVAQSPQMQSILGRIDKVAPTSSTVLITGESGVGKEVIARAIHNRSDRADRIFLPVNCGAIPDQLLESQLFGHVRGAFTGAVGAQEGMFQKARGGTVFLDEIGELPLTLQVKLLRAIESKEILPVGATQPTRVDIRIVAATNQDLSKAASAGTFRDDLYYRLNVFGIHIPPLRERPEDIPPLVEHLTRKHNEEMHRSYQGVDNAMMKALLQMHWKGNVRELDNAIEHAMIVGNGDWMQVADLPGHLGASANSGLSSIGEDLRTAMRFYEAGHLKSMLRRCKGNKKEAAKRLGIGLSSLYRKIDELEISAPPPGGSTATPHPVEAPAPQRAAVNAAPPPLSMG